MLIFPSWNPSLTPYAGELEEREYVCMLVLCVCVCIWYEYVIIAPNVFPNLNIKQTVVTKLISYLSFLIGKKKHYERKKNLVFFLINPAHFFPNYFPSLVLPPLINIWSWFFQILLYLLKNKVKCLFKSISMYTIVDSENHCFKRIK